MSEPEERLIWGQQHELDFINNMGIYGHGAVDDVSKVPPVYRIQLLKGYLEALDHPRSWFDGADVNALRAAAVDLLYLEREKQNYPISRAAVAAANKLNGGVPLVKTDTD